jgi:NAD(P)H dehydrogenase (quinone)
LYTKSPIVTIENHESLEGAIFMSEKQQPVLLVTGASGNMGRRVLELLLEAQAGTIVAATRTPEKLADFAEQGVIVRHADFDDAASLAQAFVGVDRLLLISTDMLGEPGRRIKQHTTAVQEAEKAGVKHVIYTSIVEPEPPTPVFVSADHYATEQALAHSNLDWTILRNNIYTEFQVRTLNQALQMGGLYKAAGDGKTAYVTREDCARAAAAALADDFNGKRILDITGPEALSQADLAELVTSITGKPLQYVPLELEVLVQNMVGAGLPRPLAEAYASFDTGIAQGKLAKVSNDFEQLTGRKPISVADVLTAEREALLQAVTV